MWEPEIVALVVGTFLLAGFIKGVIGMGLPVVALAFLGSTLGMREALTIMRCSRVRSGRLADGPVSTVRMGIPSGRATRRPGQPSASPRRRSGAP